MADIQNKTSHRNKPKRSCFLGCFGLSRKEEFSEKIYNTSNITKKESGPSTGWFCWSRFRRNSFRTVPIDNTENDFLQTSQTDIRSSKSNFKCKKLYRLFIKRQHPSTKTTPFQEIPTVVKVSSDQDPGPTTKEILPVEETRHVPHQNVIVEYRKSFEHGESSNSKDDEHLKRLSAHRKVESTRTRSSQPVPADNKPKPGRIAPKFSQSASFPARTRDKREYPLPQTRLTSKKSCKNDNAKVRPLDPLMGMPIVMVTLVIMLMCGRLCAILSTSAWLYMIPRLRATTNNDRSITKINDEPDINSEEYKKKVVFEGFLERDRR